MDAKDVKQIQEFGLDNIKFQQLLTNKGQEEVQALTREDLAKLRKRPIKFHLAHVIPASGPDDDNDNNGIGDDTEDKLKWLERHQEQSKQRAKQAQKKAEEYKKSLMEKMKEGYKKFFGFFEKNLPTEIKNVLKMHSEVTKLQREYENKIDLKITDSIKEKMKNLTIQIDGYNELGIKIAKKEDNQSNRYLLYQSLKTVEKDIQTIVNEIKNNPDIKGSKIYILSNEHFTRDDGKTSFSKAYQGLILTTYNPKTKESILLHCLNGKIQKAELPSYKNPKALLKILNEEPIFRASMPFQTAKIIGIIEKINTL